MQTKNDYALHWNCAVQQGYTFLSTVDIMPAKTYTKLWYEQSIG